MYERFTDRARKAMELADEEAGRLNHDYIGTEHILLALLKGGDGGAVKVLKTLEVEADRIRKVVKKLVQRGPHGDPMVGRPLTPRARRAVDLAIHEARGLGQLRVGTEHLLMGLLREQDGVAAQVLMNHGLRPGDVRDAMFHLLESRIGLTTPRRAPRVAEPEDLPAEVSRSQAELDAQIRRLSAEKEAAMDAQDFETAANLRDQVVRFMQRKKAVFREWAMNHPINVAWLSNEAVLTSLAQGINDQRRWDDLPLLADALEKAGCTDLEILDHCCRGVEHSTHCWVVDLVLNSNPPPNVSIDVR